MDYSSCYASTCCNQLAISTAAAKTGTCGCCPHCLTINADDSSWNEMESDVTEINVTTVLILSTYESNRRGYLRILYSAELYSYSSPPSFWLAYSKNAFCFFVINDVIATIRRTEINCECVRTPTIIHRWIYLSCPRRRKSNQRRRSFALTSTEAAFKSRLQVLHSLMHIHLCYQPKKHDYHLTEKPTKLNVSTINVSEKLSYEQSWSWRIRCAWPG
jgi:hypothetical protein